MRPNIRQAFFDWYFKSKWYRPYTQVEAFEAAFRAGFEKGRRFGQEEGPKLDKSEDFDYGEHADRP